MNASDVLKYGHEWFMKRVVKIPEDKWEVSGVTGFWSAKDVLSHITSYEKNLEQILQEFIDKGKSEKNPKGDSKTFNDDETAKRRDENFQEVLDEYNQAYEVVLKLIAQIPAEKSRELGTMPWYGEEYSLDDYLVYSFYGHKREHGAQFDAFIDHLK
jgi:uncharacterized damage-inducible protein DinB